MIPATFRQLDAFPLSPHGKVDRKALPAPAREWSEPQAAFAVPQTPEESVLSEIWSKVLGVAGVGRHSNFFELGGDSILSIQVVAKANQAGLRLTPKHVFQYQTI